APSRIAAVWKIIPEVDNILALDKKSLLARAATLRELPGFDVAILFPNSLRAALEVWLAGIPRRVGYCGHGRRWLLNQITREPRKPGPIQHQSQRYLRLAQQCGANTSAPLTLTTSLTGAQSNRSTSPIRIGLCPGAEYGPAKRWLPERFAEAAAKISAQAPVQWVLLGTGKDTVAGDQIARA